MPLLIALKTIIVMNDHSMTMGIISSLPWLFLQLLAGHTPDIRLWTVTLNCVIMINFTI